MTTQAKLGYGSSFKTGDGGSPETFTAWGEITSITPPARARDSVDASHELSPSAHREFIAGLVDAGEVTVEMNFVPGGATFLAICAEYDLSGSSAVKNRQIVFPDGSILAFAAFVTGDAPELPLDDKMSISVTLKVSGKPTLTQA